MNHNHSIGFVIILLVALTMQMMRGFFVAGYNINELAGTGVAVGVSIVVFFAPLLAPFFNRLFGARNTFIWGALALALLHCALKAYPYYYLFAPATALALFLVPTALIFLGGQLRAPKSYGIVAVCFGVVLDSALHSLFWTWDYLWQPRLVAWVTAWGLSLLFGVALLRLYRGSSKERIPCAETGFLGNLRYLAAGPCLLLEVMVLQNPAFVASSTGLTLSDAIALVLVGDTVGLVVLFQVVRRNWTVGMKAVCAALTAAAIWWIFSAAGQSLTLPILLARVGLSTLYGILFGLELPEARAHYRSMWRTSLALSTGFCLFVVVSSMYYLHYEFPLPVGNECLPLLAAVIIGAAAVLHPGVAPASFPVPVRGIGRVVAGTLLLPLPFWFWQPVPVEKAVPAPELRMVNYNINKAVNMKGLLDPEGIAAVIEAQKANVVTLQEVGRGWLISGGLDIAEWLSRRLNMRYFYSPAADGQFGNAILTSLPVEKQDYGILRHTTSRMMRRSYIRTYLQAGGKTIPVVCLHLQHRRTNTPDRLEQIRSLLDVLGTSPANTVIAGDMNAIPGSQEIEVFTKLGLLDAQTFTGNGHLFTAGSANPRWRIDWIFATPEAKFTDFSIPQTQASDHLPMAVTVSFP